MGRPPWVATARPSSMLREWKHCRRASEKTEGPAAGAKRRGCRGFAEELVEGDFRQSSRSFCLGGVRRNGACGAPPLRNAEEFGWAVTREVVGVVLIHLALDDMAMWL
jgi:hypothetical protein